MFGSKNGRVFSCTRLASLGAILSCGLGGSPATADVDVFRIDRTVPIDVGAVCFESSRTPRTCTVGVKSVRVAIGVLEADAYPDVALGSAGPECVGLNLRADISAYAGATLNLRVEATMADDPTPREILNVTQPAGADGWEYVALCQEAP